MVSSCFSEKWCSFPSFPTDFPQKWRTMARARNTCPPMIWALWWPPWRAAPTRWPCTSMVAASFRGAMVKWTGDEPGKTFFSTFLRYMIWERDEIIPWHIGWLTVVCATVIPFKWRLKIPSPQLIVWLWENRPSFVDWELVFQAGSILLEGIQPGFSEFLRSYSRVFAEFWDDDWVWPTHVGYFIALKLVGRTITRCNNFHEASYHCQVWVP